MNHSKEPTTEELVKKHHMDLYGDPPKLGVVHKVSILWSFGFLVAMGLGSGVTLLIQNFVQHVSDK